MEDVMHVSTKLNHLKTRFIYFELRTDASVWIIKEREREKNVMRTNIGVSVQLTDTQASHHVAKV